TGQRRAPDQVDVLARLAGLRERRRELDEVPERLLDLLLREGREPGALDGAVWQSLLGELRVHVEDLLERLEPDQLALAVEVGRDHDVVRVLPLLSERLVDRLLDRLLEQLRVDQLTGLDLPPLRVALGEDGVHEVALEADHRYIGSVVRPGVKGDPVAFALLRATVREELRDLLGAVVFFGDYQSHCTLQVVAIPAEMSSEGSSSVCRQLPKFLNEDP